MSKIKNDLPVSFDDRRHEGLMTIWWTGVQLKKIARNMFKPELASEAQFNILMILKYSDEHLTQKALSERLLVDKSNVTGLLDRLEKSEYLKRNPVPGDRRSYNITLTQAGRELVDRLDDMYMERVGLIMEEFSGDDITTLITLMTKLKKGLENSGTDGI